MCLFSLSFSVHDSELKGEACSSTVNPCPRHNPHTGAIVPSSPKGISMRIQHKPDWEVSWGKHPTHKLYESPLSLTFLSAGVKRQIHEYPVGVCVPGDGEPLRYWQVNNHHSRSCCSTSLQICYSFFARPFVAPAGHHFPTLSALKIVYGQKTKETQNHSHRVWNTKHKEHSFDVSSTRVPRPVTSTVLVWSFIKKILLNAIHSTRVAWREAIPTLMNNNNSKKIIVTSRTRWSCTTRYTRKVFFIQR